MKRKVRFGLWYDFRNPKKWQRPFGQFYADTLEQIVWAEQLGFDSVWLTEHHFCDDGYTPSPLIIASAIAARTHRMHIGTNLILLPLYHPIRVAEDAATVSLISDGRFDLGIGAGYVEKEYSTFGRQLSQRPSLMEEGVEILRRAWTGEPINFRGKRFDIGNISVHPVPESAPRIFIGAIAPPAIERAARIGDGFLSSAAVGQDDYVQALEKLECSDEGTICAGCWGIVSEDPEKERMRVGPHATYQMNSYIDMGAFGGGDGSAAPQFEKAEDALTQGFYEFWTPDEAVTKIIEHLKQYPQIEDLHFWAQFPGEPLDHGANRIKILAEKVLPKVRDAIC